MLEWLSVVAHDYISSETNHNYDLSLSTSLSSEASEEIYLSGPPLEMDMQPYRFKPVLPPTASFTTHHDIDDEVYHTTVSVSSLVDRAGYRCTCGGC